MKFKTPCFVRVEDAVKRKAGTDTVRLPLRKS